MIRFLLTSFLMLWIGVATITAQEIEEQITDTLTKEEADWYYSLFDADIDFMDIPQDSIPPVRRKPAYIASFSHTVVYKTSESYSSCILILIKDDIYQDSQVAAQVIRYAQDLYYALQKTVVIETVSNEYHNEIKTLLKQYYYEKGLIGATLIGNIDCAIYEQTYESKPEVWPCDLYYMDLDGTWLDLNENGRFDAHRDNVNPEIFIGRLICANTVSDKTLLNRYFDKNHQYWLGKMPIGERYGLAYINEKEWCEWSKMQGIEYLYGEDNYLFFRYNEPNFGSRDYLKKIKLEQYEFVQLAAHSNYNVHRFLTSDRIYLPAIDTISPTPIGYNLFCCIACNWVSSHSSTPLRYRSANGFMGGAYISNTGNALSVVGSTKSGGMLQFKYFYQPLSLGKSMGESLKDWWVNYAGSRHTQYEIHWYYGLTIIGDPFISMKYNTNTTCQETLVLTEFDNTIGSDLRYYRASERIEVGGNYVIPVGKHVIFDAPEIAFLPGFQCPVGSTFETRTEGCECNHITTPQRNNAPRRIDQTKDESTETQTEQITDFQVYPNPVQDILQITSSEPIEAVVIYTLSGERVLQARSTQVDVSNLKEGMYIVQATSQAGRHFTAKVVKQ